MEIAPDIVEAGKGTTGRAEISFEQSARLDADLLLILTNGGNPSDIPGYDNLAAVQAGAVVELDYALAVGLNTPSVLSIPWALDQIHPQLVIAAGK